MMPCLTTSGGYVLGANGRLALVDSGRGTFLLEDATVTDWTVDVFSELDAFGFCDGWSHFASTPPEISAKLTLSVMKIHQVDTVPKDLRCAEDMTVRQLFAEINRKLKARKQDG